MTSYGNIRNVVQISLTFPQIWGVLKFMVAALLARIQNSIHVDILEHAPVKTVWRPIIAHQISYKYNIYVSVP